MPRSTQTSTGICAPHEVAGTHACLSDGNALLGETTAVFLLNILDDEDDE